MAKPQLTPDGWRREKQEGHSRRAYWMDYRSPSIMLLTLVIADRKPLLGALQGGQIIRTPFGQLVAEEIERIPTYNGASSIEICSYVIMPDHVHILLQIHERIPKHLGHYIGWFKLKCADLYHQPSLTTADASSICSVLGDVPPRNTTPIFAPEYHDRLLIHRGQLNHMKRYIHDNPRRLWIKRNNPDLFRIRQNIRFGQTTCTALGNIFLADYPQHAVVQCSRLLTQAEIDTRKEACLAEAANGTVFVSAAISEGEKQICRALREAGFPIIILLENGFPEPDSPHYRYFKPQGVYFEACAAGKLLFVEPSQAFYERPDIATKIIAKAGDIPHDTQRYRFLALNAMAEEIAGTDKC